MSHPTVISVQNLTKSFGSLRAIDGLSFSVQQGECFGLLGPNGAGKTTTMKVLYGKAEANKDPLTAVSVLGFNPKNQLLEIKARCGIVPQINNLDSELRVADNLFVYARFYGMESSEARERIAELLEFMELKDKAHSKTKELSGGMQRRLVIARALLGRPRLLILDEPTTGLDPQVRHLIWNKLRELKREGITILLTTHYMEEAFQICDRIGIMDNGKMLVSGSPVALLEEQLERYVVEIYNKTREDKVSYEGIRFEWHDGVFYGYGRDLSLLSSFAGKFAEGDYYIRQSNLEDLFLKVTGRSLNEHQ